MKYLQLCLPKYGATYLPILSWLCSTAKDCIVLFERYAGITFAIFDYQVTYYHIRKGNALS